MNECGWRTVPRAVVDLVAEILRNMAQGRGVSIVPSTAELTTQQAADELTALGQEMELS
jgi:hypothetical protein